MFARTLVFVFSFINNRASKVSIATALVFGSAFLVLIIVISSSSLFITFNFLFLSSINLSLTFCSACKSYCVAARPNPGRSVSAGRCVKSISVSETPDGL